VLALDDEAFQENNALRTPLDLSLGVGRHGEDRATQRGVMLARLLPQSDRGFIAGELARMGNQCLGDVVGESNLPLAGKLIGVPLETATALTAWLQQQESACWWHSVPGASPATVDVLFGGRHGMMASLRQSTPHAALLQPVVTALEQALHLQEQAPARLLLGQTAWDLRQRTYVMGILNVTPDSFSDGGFYLQPEQAIKHAETMLAAGADVIDVGGQSSRPGATPVPATVEQERVVPVVREIVKRYGALVSVDTYRASVAAAALDAGAVLINDISALRFDAQLAPLIARRGASVVLMHMQGTPQTMQKGPSYRHVLDDVYGFLTERLHWAMQYGIDRQRIVLDPGFGFGKALQHNLELLHGLEHFRALGQPLLVGMSRKSFLGRLLRRQVWERLEGTLASVIYAVLRGATIVRVHDVAPVVEAVRLIEALVASRHPSLEAR
jgi:dihydropteroate synthase